MHLTRLRHITQTIAFAISNLGIVPALKTGFCYPFLHCYGCPLASGACPIGTLQNFIILPLFPFYLIGMLGVYGTLFGRSFCGWACPFGAVQDVIGGLAKGRKISGRKLPPSSYVKFAMLLIVVVAAWITLDTLFCKFCPAGSLFAAIPAVFAYPSLQRGIFFYLHLATLIVTVVLVLLFSRFWCRYLCPFGTIGVFNRLSVLTISRNPAECTECLDCLEACPMGIAKLADIGSSSDCILCGRCIEACPRNALKMAVRK